MKGKKYSVGSLVLIFVIIMISTSAMAQRYRNDGQPRGFRQESCDWSWSSRQGWKAQLNLTDEQSAKIEAIKLASSEGFIARRNKINELEAQLNSAMTGETINKAQANNLIEEIAKLKAENQKARVDDHFKIRALLTDQQKVIMDQHRSQSGRFGGRGRG